MTISLTKGTDIANSLLLGQYQNSVNLKEYIQDFVDEMDMLFAQTEEVYLGRFLNNAVGRQLDIIGIILDQGRTVNIPTQFFGFKDDSGTVPPNVAPLADESSSFDGGVFRSEGQSDTGASALSDNQYRRLLKAKAYLLSVKIPSINTSYDAVSILLGYTPRILRMIPDGRSVELEVSSEDVSLADAAFISYLSKYFIPIGTTFAISRL